MNRDIANLLDALAEIFAAEGRPGGDLAANALRTHRTAPINLAGSETALSPQIRQILAADESHPLARAIAPVESLLPWHHSGLADGRIRPEIAHHMATCEILGSRGTVACHTCRVGLFFQSANLDYPDRNHMAEETFFIISGQGEWRCGYSAWHAQPPGGYVHHPSMVPHQSRTTGQAILTAWRWTGDVAFETYRLLG